MSAWGNTDNTTIAGTVTTYTANVNVVGASTYFTVNVRAGDYLTISGQGKYQIAEVASNTALTLTTIPTAAATGKTVFLQQGPKYEFSNNTMPVARQSNTVSIQTIFGVDSTEMVTVAVDTVAIANVGAGYQRLANATAITANTTGVFTTTGLSQPTRNAIATITFTNNVLSAITVTDRGSGYAPAANTIAVTANTSFVIATTGLSQPTINALGTISFTAAGTASNASHTGWVSVITYTDAFGNMRERSEVLVAMSKNGITQDDEDVTFPD